MNIYLVDRIDDNSHYPDYLSFVVIAKTRKQAIVETTNAHSSSWGWATADKLKAKLVGRALAKDKKPYILHEASNLD
jgi:hypothetical protein